MSEHTWVATQLYSYLILFYVQLCFHCLPIGYSGSYYGDLHYGHDFYWLPSNMKAIQSEIFTNGPITVGIEVYEDFYNYKSGK